MCVSCTYFDFILCVFMFTPGPIWNTWYGLKRVKYLKKKSKLFYSCCANEQTKTEINKRQHGRNRRKKGQNETERERLKTMEVERQIERERERGTGISRLRVGTQNNI